jgi:polyisoprenoid-binding protein YceI
MKMRSRLGNLLLGLCLAASAGAAWADWELDNMSSAVNFVTIKNNAVGEVNTIKSLEGSIGVHGDVQLTLHLASVETLIEIRNERLRELLFETKKFPVAIVTAEVDPALFAASNGGGVRQVDLPLTLAMHGEQKVLNAFVSVVVEDDGDLIVTTVHPVLVNASDFGLEGGIEALRKVAGLDSISNVVPVSMQLRFVRTK